MTQQTRDDSLASTSPIADGGKSGSSSGLPEMLVANCESDSSSSSESYEDGVLTPAQPSCPRSYDPANLPKLPHMGLSDSMFTDIRDPGICVPSISAIQDDDNRTSPSSSDEVGQLPPIPHSTTRWDRAESHRDELDKLVRAVGNMGIQSAWEQRRASLLGLGKSGSASAAHAGGSRTPSSGCLLPSVPSPSAVRPGVHTPTIEGLFPRLRKEDIQFKETTRHNLDPSTSDAFLRLLWAVPSLLEPPSHTAPGSNENRGVLGPEYQPTMIPKKASAQELRRKAFRTLQCELMDVKVKKTVHAVVVVESRCGEWMPVGKAKDDVPLVAKPEMPSPWLLPVTPEQTGFFSKDGMKRGESVKMHELADFRVMSHCPDCSAVGTTTCLCSSMPADECFWCSGSGKRKGKKCDSCNAKGTYQCRKCNNSGEIKCTTCEGSGNAELAYVVKIKHRQIDLPSLPLRSLLPSASNGGSPMEQPSVETVRDLAINKTFEAVENVHRRALSGRSSPAGSGASTPSRPLSTPGSEPRSSMALPVAAMVVIEHSTVRAYAISRKPNVSDGDGAIGVQPGQTRYFAVSDDEEVLPTEVKWRHGGSQHGHDRAE